MTDPLEELLRAAVHDIRGPVNQARALVGLLSTQHKDALAEDGQRLCEYIEMAAARAATVVDAIDDFANALAAPAMETVDMNAVLAAAQSRIGNRRRAMIRSGDLGFVRGDSPMLTTVLCELLDNSMKFNHSETPEIRIEARNADGALEYSISDNGIGIPPERAEIVFKPLKRLNGFEYPGAGMGLAIARRIVEAHGGRIWIAAAPSGGAEVRFTLPAAVR